ncbi:MAG: 3-oxoacid CoA-transferase subunit B [Rhodospirillales bacterium]|jgi:3-oxoacid CoA-transferase B subunit|nr:3-oxoacid CoA-transferase subunit B [Rhodospirillales bacterium]MDP6805911.1 3-oxoacid CoA-transferase subunit B [Rhodospirillales bacterium]
MGTATLEKAGLDREQMAKRLALELQDGWLVNLGIGMPTKCLPYVPPERDVLFHSENGIIGMGPPPADPADADNDLLSAGKSPVTLIPGGCFIHHADSFAISRGGRLDATILGAYQVAENGNLANWRLPNARTGSVGGAMDIAVGSKRVFAIMTHVTREGEAKVVNALSYPLTALRSVTKIFTDMAVIAVTADGLVLEEVAPGLTPDDVQAATEPKLTVSPSLKTIEV